MRKLSVVAALLLLTPAVGNAKTLEDLLVEKGVITKAEAGSAKSMGGAPAKVYWNDGTALQFPDSGFTFRANTTVQTRYTYTDNNQDGNTAAVDSSSFDVNLAKLTISGSALHEEFDYVLEGDFASFGSNAANATNLADAYLRWNNCDWSSIQMGQFKTAISRQFNTADHLLQFADRSGVSDYFSLGRQQGVSANLSLMDGRLMAEAGIFNGLSDGEGQNLPGNDKSVTGEVGLRANIMGKVDAHAEGDIDNSDELGWDLGAVYAYTEAKQDVGAATLDDVGLNEISVDTNVKSGGFSLHGEYFYGRVNPDLAEKTTPTGAYIQAGYFLQPQKWEVAARWGILDCDEGAARGECSGMSDINEAAAAINYYWWKHNLKAGLNYAVRVFDPEGDGSDDYKSNRWLLQVAMHG